MPARPFRLAAALLLAAAPFALAAQMPMAQPSVAIGAAVADSRRPDADKARDAERKPAETLAFAGVRPGMTVFELLPGGGYFTRIFAGAVGPGGRVVSYIPTEMLKPGTSLDAKRAELGKGYDNIMLFSNALLDPNPPEDRNAADVVFTAQNYHDLHNLPGADIVQFDRLVFDALKPGGVYIVIDHSAPAGSGLADTNTLHRIDPETVRKEVEAAGFRFVGQSPLLANPADPKTNKVFDPSIRGHTDQFMFKFVKPAG